MIIFPGVHLKLLQKFKAVYKSGQLIFVDWAII